MAVSDNGYAAWLQQAYAAKANGQPIPAQPAQPSAGVGPTPAQDLASQMQGQAGNAINSHVYYGSPYQGESGIADLTKVYGQDFIYGRDPNYASQHAANSENAGLLYADAFTNLGNATYGQAQQGQQALINTGQGAQANEQNLGLQAINRGAIQTNRADTFTGQALGVANNLAGQGGQSAAQAQLQSGLNQAQASNLALARSGRGFGGSAAAMGQAVDANSAAGQNAANSSALLRMQGQQAAAGIYGGAAQQNMNAALANSQQGLNMYGQGYNTNLQAQQAGYGMGLQGNTLTGQMFAQGGNEYFAGQNAAKAWTDAQHQADYEREALAMQQYGITSGVDMANNAAQAQQTGAILGAAGTIAGAAIGTFAGGPAGGAAGAAIGGAAGQAANYEAQNAGYRGVGSDIRMKTNVQPADGQVPAGMQGEDLETALTRPRMAPPRPVSADRIAAIHAKLDALLSQQPKARPVVVAVPAQAPAREAVSPVDENFSGYYRVPVGLDPEADKAAVQQISFPEEVTSDEDSKGNKGGAGDEIADTFGNLHGYSYDYRDPARDGHGRQYGIMAQDLAQTPAGASVVEPDNRGMLTVNAPKLSMMNAAATGAHERRIAELEAQLDALLGKSKAMGERPPTVGQVAEMMRGKGATAAVPTARFADVSAPPTARYDYIERERPPTIEQAQRMRQRGYEYDDNYGTFVPIAGTAATERPQTVEMAQAYGVPSGYSYDYAQPATEVIPMAVGSADATPWGGVDIAALDDAQRRQGGTVREDTY